MRQRVTYDISNFIGDKKGLRVGDKVEINSNGMRLTGEIIRIFKFYNDGKEEAKIAIPGGNRLYRIEELIDKK